MRGLNSSDHEGAARGITACALCKPAAMRVLGLNKYQWGQNMSFSNPNRPNFSDTHKQIVPLSRL